MNIRETRERLGLTQPELAKILGVRVETICRWERRHFKPHPLSQARIDQILAEMLAAKPEPQSQSEYMGVTTYEGIVENGQIRLPAAVRLPERTKVYIVIPGVEVQTVGYTGSPRLVHPEQAANLEKLDGPRLGWDEQRSPGRHRKRYAP